MSRPRSSVSKDHISYFFEYGIDMDSKLIDFSTAGNSEVDLDSALAVRTIKSLRILDKIRPEEPITLLVNCEGGDVDAGLAVYDAILACKSPVHIEVIGVCYSMAAWVLQAGDVRRMHPHSSVMIHDGEGSVAGKKHEIDSSKKFSDEQDIVCEDILLDRIRERHPSFSRGRLRKLLATDTYLHPKQALELGLIDEIVGEI